MRNGELAIIINDFAVYHPECYRKEREAVFDGLGVLREGWLEDAASRINDFAAVANPDKIKDYRVFFDSWGKLMMVPEFLTTIVSDAQRMGVIGGLHEYQLKRKISRAYHTIVGIAAEYREGFGAINIEIKQREMFPFIKESGSEVDSFDKLREEEKKASLSIVDEMKSICEQNKSVLEEVKGISKKLTEAEKKELKKQIENIKKEARPLI